MFTTQVGLQVVAFYYPCTVLYASIASTSNLLKTNFFIVSMQKLEIMINYKAESEASFIICTWKLMVPWLFLGESLTSTPGEMQQ